MKRIVFSLIALLSTISAFPFDLPENAELRPAPQSGRRAEPSKPDLTATFPRSETKRILGATKAVDFASIEGEWVFQFGDYYFEDSILGSLFLTYAAAVEGNIVYFTYVGEEDKSYLPFTGMIFDDEDGAVIVFTKTHIGQVRDYQIFQDPYDYNSFTNSIEHGNVYAFYYPEGGILEFMPDTGIAWSAYYDEAGQNIAGYFDIFDIINGRQEISEDNYGEWEDMGEALFMDGWVLPALAIDQTAPENQYNVPLQRNKENPNLYRLVGPYHYGPLAFINESQDTGHILFDVTDPDHVVFLQADAGFSSAALLVNRFYCYNRLGSLLLKGTHGFTIEEIIANEGDAIPYTTFKDGVVTLSHTDVDGNVTYDANFGYESDPFGGFCWDYANMDAKITFPVAAVERIPDNNAVNSPVYNLQGVKVGSTLENLPKGIYIKDGKKIAIK